MLARVLSHVVVAAVAAVAIMLHVIYVPPYSVRSSAVCRSTLKCQTGGHSVARGGSTDSGIALVTSVIIGDTIYMR